MRSLIACSIVIITLYSGCDNNSDPKHSDSDTSVQKPIAEPKDEPNVIGCYMRVMGRDTLVVRLNQSGDNVSGHIYFDNFEKDGSRGTATGKIRQDTVRLYYNFQSEGMKSVMEMFFQVTKDELIPGAGDIGVKNDTAYFTSPAAITFPGKDKLQRMQCDELPIKFRIDN